MHSVSSRHCWGYIFIVLVSVAISIWTGTGGFVLNTDGICYLQSAENLSQGGLHAAMQVCGQAKWPFYSVLIAGLVYLSKCSFVAAAYFLNGCFSVISVIAFINIVLFVSRAGQSSEYSSATQRSLFWFAAIVILFSKEFNSVKYYIIRDHGFWACYLLSILMLLHFFQSPRWRYATAWFFSLVTATLFRLEGAIFLMMLPLLAFFNSGWPWAGRARAFFKLTLLPIVLCSCLAIWVFIAAPENLGRLDELLAQMTYGLSQLALSFRARTNNLSQYVLNLYSARDAEWILLITLMVWYVISIIKNVSMVYAILAMYAWGKRLLKTSYSIRLVLWGYLIVNVLITALFLGENMFLSKRYLIALSLIIMVWVPFALQYLYLRWPYKKWPLVIASLFIFVNALGGIVEFGYSKQYIQDAGGWLAKHTPQDAKIMSNDRLVMYYSHRFGNQLLENAKLFKNIDIIKHGKWRQYDYIALRVNKKDLPKCTSLMQELNGHVVQVFANKRGDQVIIYNTH